ncbi:MAG: hypothetical protein U0694_27005 [Anaerolineae bacterium]
MQSRYTVHIIPTEWRWVIFVGSGLVLLAFMPFLWAALSNTAQSNWQFMGMIGVNYRDGATYLAKMLQGMEGSLLIRFLHTPEPHNPFFLVPIYPVLGQASRLTGLPIIVMYHIARVGTSLFMYLAIYQLGATIWMRVRTRRIFFMIASVGAGFGWVFTLLTGDTSIPDISIPEAFPLFSTYVNVHFPLTLACVSILASVFISAFRPGMDENPGMTNGGLLIVVLTSILGVLYPQTLAPIGIALLALTGLRSFRARKFDTHVFYWTLALLLTAVPFALYYVAVTASNPIVAEWNRQNVTLSPSPLAFVVGLGLPLIIAIPAIYRALRRFEADGDQFMLLWLVMVLIAVYLPTSIQRRFAAGIMIIIAYFATRAVEDFWFNYVSRRWRRSLFVMAVPVMAFSEIFTLVIPVIPVLVGNFQAAAGMMLERDYRAAFEWLSANRADGDVILASPNVSLWIPSWTGQQVVYGHPFETLQAAEKEQAVVAWFTSSTAEDCQRLLAGAYSFSGEYHVRYVLVGPEERIMGTDPNTVESACLDNLEVVAQIGDVTIYAP